MGWLKNLFAARAPHRPVSNRRPSCRLRVDHLEDRLVPASLPTGFTEAVTASGLTSPTTMEFAPDGRLFITEQAGTMEVWLNGTRRQANFFRDTPIATDTTSERGLLGVAFDPNYAANRFVYAYYTTAGGDFHNRVSRFTADAAGELAVAGSEQVIWEGDPHSAGNHNGGAIHFGADGKLYIATGDNAQGSTTAQSLTSQHGKILRINADGTVPADNPFNDGAGPNKDTIWALGLRNPFTFAIQPGSGRMFIGDVGQNSWEEINEGGAGRNYGWATTEGDFSQAAFPNFTRPFFAYNHSAAVTTPSGNVLTGGAFYNPVNPQFPADYQGDYFFADVGAGWIYRIDTATKETTAFASGAGAVDLKVTADGSLYYLSRWSDKVFQVVYNANLAPQITQQPQDRTVGLGQTATFTADASGTPVPTFQWQRSTDGQTWADVAGATTRTLSLNPQPGDSGALFRVRAANASGTVFSTAARLTVLSDSPPNAPTITIDGGLTGGKFTAGQPVQFSGTATDAEDGPLAAGAFSWTINYLTSIAQGDQDGDGLPGLTRPFDSPTGVAASTFTPATVGPYNLTDVAYSLTLTVRDAQGLTATRHLVISPNTATITLLSNPTGGRLTLDTQPVTAPVTVDSVVGFLRPIGAPPSQTVGGVTYDFVSWSDGGAAQHNVATTAAASTYTATYAPRQNLALGRPATASSLERGDLVAGNAFDGNAGTRWSSGFSDDQWVQVDLGDRYDIRGVRLNWENAYGKRYRIDVSDDAVHWQSVYETPADSDGGIDDVAGLTGTGRYVRVQGLVRSSPYGYSLWEAEVYGTAAAPTNGAPTVAAPARVVGRTANTATLAVLGDDDGGESNLTYTWDVVARPAGAADPVFGVNGSNAAKDTAATFSAGGSYTLRATIRDAGGLTVTSTVDVSVTGPNLALGKMATASSVENGGLTAGKAVDGNAGSRWSSGFSDDQWVQADLGARYSINEVKLNWENAYGKRYHIDVSDDGRSWSTVYTTAADSDGGTDDLTGLAGVGRFVRMVGLARSSPYGYSLWEFEVYGGRTGDGNQAPNVVVPPAASPTAAGVALSVLGDDDGGESALKYTWNVTSRPAGAADPVFSRNGTNAAKDTTATFAQAGTYTLLVTLRDAGGLTATRSVDVTAYGPDLARNRPATASSVENGGTAAANAFDGSGTTRWSSRFSDDQWVQVDLGAVYAVSRVALNWENAYARAYQIQVSADGVTWTTVYATGTARGGVEDLTGLGGTGRYVRMLGTQRATAYGYSLWDMAVYGTPA